MKSKYYQQELESLRDSAAEFSSAYPTLAPQLSGPRPDPDVERILEGVAFLTGQIRSTLDEGFPEFAQGVLNQVFPHFLRPIPSSTIIKFEPKKILNGTLHIKRGTYVDSSPVDGVNCRFRTCYDVDVAPIRVESVTKENSTQGRTELTLHLEMHSMSLSTWKADSLRFYIGGDYAGASDLLYLLMNYSESVSVEDETTPDEKYYFPKNSLSYAGLGKDDSILTYPSNSFPSYRLLQEYFQLKEKFLFFELKGLSSWTRRGGSNKFRISFMLKESPIAIPKVNLDRFQLHATPVVNLFETDAEPVLLDNRNNEIRIRPTREGQGAVQVYSVDSVVGRSRGSDQKTQYIPLGVEFGSGGVKPVYQVTFKSSQDDIVEPYMMVSYPDGYSLPETETLLIKLTCTNGSLPTKLRPGDVSKRTSDTSELVDFTNILPPTEYQAPPSDGAVMWRMLSHLSINYLPVADVDNFKSLLSLYIFSGGDRKNEIANRRRIDGVKSITVNPSDRLISGVLMRGQEIEVSVDKDHFTSEGDLFVFGSVINDLFSSFTSLNVYSMLMIKDVNSGEQFEWPATLGEQALI